MDLNAYIRDVPNFPKEGIIFKDITPLLGNPDALRKAGEMLLETCPTGIHIDKVVGVESRGFIYGMWLAEKLNAGFVPVRKPNKLPAEKISQTYALEYGTDALEMHADAIRKGDVVIIHDDVLATGGTAEAVAKLVEKAGGKVLMFSFLIELAFLNGRNKLSPHKVCAVLTY